MLSFCPSVKQLRALAAVAPGSILLSADTFKQSTFIVAEDDQERTGVWGITVTRDGDVTEHRTLGQPDRVTSYPDLIEREQERVLDNLNISA